MNAQHRINRVGNRVRLKTKPVSGNVLKSSYVPPAAFFMVWRQCESNHWPVVRHATQFKAEMEALRLAKANPGHEFFVLKTTSSALAEVLPVGIYTIKRKS